VSCPQCWFPSQPRAAEAPRKQGDHRLPAAARIELAVEGETGDEFVFTVRPGRRAEPVLSRTPLDLSSVTQLL
jgi:hypothetical protein